MRRFFWIGVLAVLVGSGLALAADDSLDPHSYVPREHWAYDAVQQLAQRGIFTGFPDRTGSGRPVYTRYQFAQFTRTMLRGVSFAAGTGRRLWKSPKVGRECLTNFRRLMAEFQRELRMVELEPEQLQQALQRFDRWRGNGRPQGVLEPLVASNWDMACSPEARAEGVRQAAEEWERGEVVLCTLEVAPMLKVRLSGAIPIRKEGGREPDDSVKERIAGHNAEVWRRLRQSGPPDRSRLTWLPLVFDLAGTWRRDGRGSLRLNRQYPGVKVPNTGAVLVWDLIPRSTRGRGLDEQPDGRLIARQDRPPYEQKLVVDTGSREVEVALPIMPPPDGWLDVLWGPPGSGVAFLRLRVSHDREMPYRLYAVDLQMGCLLNAEAARE
jgi:S-layer family protein